MKRMIEKDPWSYSWLEYAWVVMLSCFGAAAHFLEANRKCLTRDKLMDFLIDVTIAPFTAICIFYLCESLKVEKIMTAAIIGLISHAGPRYWFVIRRSLLDRIINKKINETQDE